MPLQSTEYIQISAIFKNSYISVVNDEKAKRRNKNDVKAMNTNII